MTMVAISGLHSVENPSPGLNVARCLRSASRDGLRLVGYAYHPLYTGVFDEVFDEVRLVRHPVQMVEDARASNCDLVVPTIDYEIQVLAEQFRSGERPPGIPPYEGVSRLSKKRLADLAPVLDLPVPETHVATSLEEVRGLTRLEGGTVLKGSVYGGFPVQDEDVTVQLAERLLQTDGEVIVQRRVQGDEFGIAGVAWEGRLLGIVAMRKLGFTEAGTTWSGISIEAEDFLGSAASFCEATAWTGGFEIELIREDYTHRMFLIEINSRFPTWVYLSTGVDANLPALLLGAAEGQIPDTVSEGRFGMMFTRVSTDRITPVADLATLVLEGRYQHAS